MYEYYKKLPEKKLPATLEEMEPLFAAVAHGCQAGRHEEALDYVYRLRIKQGTTEYITQLGAFGADLSALSNFFEILWSQPASGLKDADKADVLGWAGFCFRALGHLREAVQPMQAGMDLYNKQYKWVDAGIIASNLSEIYLTLGEIGQAVTFARQSVYFARGSDYWEMLLLTTVANALHQSGELVEAEKLFHEAESMYKLKGQLDYPEFLNLQGDHLCSVGGYEFCDLLLDQGQYQEVFKRASQALKYNEHSYGPLSIALDKLSLGRAFLLRALVEGSYPSLPGNAFNQARDYLNQAVTGLREAGTQHHIPRGLFARAALYRVQGEFAKAWADLDEAHEIAERGGMGIHLADYHLEACKLQMASGKLQEAKEHLEKAAARIEKMGYGRRKPEVEILRQELAMEEAKE